MTSDLTNQLEDAIRAELRTEVRQAPSGAATKASVLNSVAGLPMDENVRPLRRWLVPMLAAAAVMLVAVGLTIGARSLNSAGPDRPGQPIHQPRLTPPPPYEEDCSEQGYETLANGAQTIYLDTATMQPRYVFEYYCASADGSRSASRLQIFRRVAGILRFDGEPQNVDTPDVIVLSLTGDLDGFRAVEAVRFNVGWSSPDVVETAYHVPYDGRPGDGTEVAPGCRQADLTVRLATAQLPAPHRVLQLTNHSTSPCAVWGNPRYTPQTAAGLVGSQPVRYLLRGPAGGVTTAPSAPVLILQPGQEAAASIGTGASAGCIPTAKLGIVLPGEVDLGVQPFSACGIDSYPLVAKAAGDDSADYPTEPQPTGPASCVDSGQLLLGSHPVSSQSGDAAGLVLTIKLLGGPPCTLSGYPDVRAVDSSKSVLVTAAHTPRGTHGGLASGTTTPPTVTLTAGQTASTLVEWTAAAYTPTSACHRNGRISLTLGATGATYNPTIGQLCDLVVHPIVPGDTGSQ